MFQPIKTCFDQIDVLLIVGVVFMFVHFLWLNAFKIRYQYAALAVTLALLFLLFVRTFGG